MSENASSRQQFLFGLSTGIAAFAVVAFFVMVGLYINKPNGLTEEDGSDGEVAGEQIDGSDQPANPDDLSGQPAEFTITKEDKIRGNFDAPITIVEFSDFECPFCARFHGTMQQVMQEYGDKVRWVYKHFPLDSIHPNARPAAIASECANEQGKFWEYADKLIENQQTLSEATFKRIAGEINLNKTQFESCLSSDKYTDKVDAEYNEGISKGVRGTPGSYVNGEALPGAVPFEQIKAVIDAQLQ